MLLMLGGMLAATPSLAQGPQGRGQGQGGGGGMLQRMQEELKLSDDQMDKLKPIFEKYNKETRALREKATSGERTPENMQAMRADRQKLQEATNAKVAEVLTDEQMEGYKKMQQRRGGRGGRGGPGGGGRRGGPPRQ